MTTPDEIPPLVARALRYSLQQGYLEATRSETGRLLATLAAASPGPIADCGTGCGVGAAWLRTGARPGTQVVTAEVNHDLVDGVRQTFAGADVDVSCADWTSLAAKGPFALVFLDRGTAEKSGIEPVLEMAAVGGVIVIDDVACGHCWPPMLDGRVDEVRMSWLSDPRVAGSQVQVAADAAVLVCTRVR